MIVLELLSLLPIRRVEVFPSRDLSLKHYFLGLLEFAFSYLFFGS